MHQILLSFEISCERRLQTSNWKLCDHPRLAICDNRGRIKYNEKEEMGWIFSPRYAWNNMPEEIRSEIDKYNLKWDWYGIYILNERISSDIPYVIGKRSSFFIYYSKNELAFNRGKERYGP